MPFVTTWTDRESIILREVSQDRERQIPNDLIQYVDLKNTINEQMKLKGTEWLPEKGDTE